MSGVGSAGISPPGVKVARSRARRSRVSLLTRAADTFAPTRDERHGPLVPLLLVLTMVTGLVDSVSYLKLGHVSVANTTGNVVFLGLALVHAEGFSMAASLTAIAAFLVGALAGGRISVRQGHHRARHLAIASAVQLVLVGAALIVSATTTGQSAEHIRSTLIVLLGLAMGLQNATTRRLGVPDLTTTVLTFTLTGIAADSKLAGGRNPRPVRRIVSTAIMLLGAAIGALLVFNVGVTAALALAMVLLALNGIAAYRVSSSSAGWTAPNTTAEHRSVARTTRSASGPHLESESDVRIMDQIAALRPDLLRIREIYMSVVTMGDDETACAGAELAA